MAAEAATTFLREIARPRALVAAASAAANSGACAYPAQSAGLHWKARLRARTGHHVDQSTDTAARRFITIPTPIPIAIIASVANVIARPMTNDCGRYVNRMACLPAGTKTPRKA